MRTIRTFCMYARRLQPSQYVPPCNRLTCLFFAAKMPWKGLTLPFWTHPHPDRGHPIAGILHYAAFSQIFYISLKISKLRYCLVFFLFWFLFFIFLIFSNLCVVLRFVVDVCLVVLCVYACMFECDYVLKYLVFAYSFAFCLILILFW